MNIKEQKMYSEVYGVLNMLGDSYINKLPVSLYNMIKDNKLETYNPTYNSDASLAVQNIQRESLSMIALFHLNYWCKDDEEKKQINDLLNENEAKYQNILREKYNPDKLFENRKSNDKKVESIEIAQYNESFFTKLINKIKKIFKR